MSEKRKGEAKRRVADRNEAMTWVMHMANAGMEMPRALPMQLKYQLEVIRDFAASEIARENR